MASAQPAIQITGHLHGLARKIGKIGGEHLVMAVTSHDLDKWDRLVGATEGDVKISIEVSQGSLGLGKKGGKKKGKKGEDLPAGVQKGSEAASGALRAQD